MAKVPPLPKASPRGGGGLVFSKESLDTPKRSGMSALSAALSSGPRKNSGEHDNNEATGGVISPRLTQSASSTSMLTTSPKNTAELKDGDKGELATPPVSVFTPFVCCLFVKTAKDPKPVKITVRITQECSKSTLLLSLLQQTFGRSQKDAAGLLKSVDLRPADDDGSPDEDCPTLDDRQSVHRFGVSTFTITSREEDDSILSTLEPINTNDVSIGERDKAPGVDPNLRLLHASEKGDLDTVRHMLETKAADVTSTGIDNFNCLHFAARKGHLNVVTYLLKHAEQLHIDSRTKNGWTPLHLACCQGHYDVAEQLLSCGADAVAVTSANATATDLAQQNGHSALVELVKEFLPA